LNLEGDGRLGAQQPGRARVVLALHVGTRLGAQRLAVVESSSSTE
jgi:hypothetical protein